MAVSEMFESCYGKPGFNLNAMDRQSSAVIYLFESRTYLGRVPNCPCLAERVRSRGKLKAEALWFVVVCGNEWRA